ERDNADLRNFLSQLNRFSLAEYSEKLRKIDSYLVFTINTADADRVKLNIDDDVQYRLTNLSHDLLVQGLEKKLAHLSRDLETAGAHVEVMRKNQDTLISTLKTMPRLAEFVDYYLAAAARGEGPMDLEEALRRCDDVGYWFQRELSDFEQWCFTLSLGLAHRLGDSQDVSWFSFESLRRSVVAWLKDDSELFPKEKEQSRTSAADQKGRKLRLLDDDFLNFCRAEIAKDHDSLSDLIVFRSRSYSSRLWDVLLQHYRSILCVLLPHLSEAAENGDRPNQPFHRELCAQIIGRIGEIDPERITAPLMDRWMYSDVLSHQALVGALYQGILASNSQRYRNSFLDRLNALSNLYSVDEDEEKSWNDHDVVAIVEEAAKTDDKKIEKKHMLALTAVYAQIGDKHFELAMKGLERIAEKQLVPLIENVQRVGRLLERSESWFQQRLTNKEARELRNFQTILSNVIERIYNQQRYTFAGVQCAFWLLSLNLDPITVFAELRGWIKKSSQTTGALVALMFLYEEGIARDLESHQVEVASSKSGSSERHSCNAILASLKSDESVLEMARFLVTLYESFSIPFVFPSQMAQYLEESLMLRLKTWAEEALPIESCRHAMKKLFIELMRVHQGVLFDRVYRLLHDKKFGKKHPELKKEFVDAVLWQSR
ncbi:MAG TPA: hypothetical protein VFS77_20530, partial [Pyrinomonadaceae bacterium]|nr:hypothetical protein [Pyrinomonadaceae bacterium]